MQKIFKLHSIIFAIGILLFSCLPVKGQVDENYGNNVKKAFAATSTAECQFSLEFCIEVLKITPNHPTINYLAARLNVLLGNEDIALNQLIKATELGYTTKLPFNNPHQLNDTAFSELRKEKEFEKVIKALTESEKPIHKSQVAFTISDKDLLPDGIAYDPVEEMFYLGSETKHKIVKVDPHGNSTDFTAEGQDGLNMVIGVNIDPVGRTLWACSYEKNKQSIYKYDLSSGELIKRYLLPPDGTGRNFNDLVIHPNGDIYISTPVENAIYMISHISDTLELFFKGESIVESSGITLSDDGRVIYLADFALGICKIDIDTKSFALLSHEPGFSPYGIDGLYFNNNNLFAVQMGLNQVSKFSLNSDGTHIENIEIIERNGPYLHRPTTGVIVDDYFYFLADPPGKSDKLEGVIVMKTPIK